MTITKPVPGVEVDFEPDTEDITIESDPAAAAWERLADAYASGEHCPDCMWDERGYNIYSKGSWRECHCADPNQCIAISPRAIANALKRQAE